MKLDQSQITPRIELLEQFVTSLDEWKRSHKPTSYEEQTTAPERRATIQSWTHRHAMAIQRAILDAGIGTGVMVAPPPAFGGIVARVDVIREVFEPRYGKSFVDDAIRLAQQAAGFYENLRDQTGLVRLPSTAQTLDIVEAIERALRPSFRSGPPTCERDVQDQIEVILRAIGVEFTREQETAPVGARASKPDFVLQELDTALEVKFANDKHSESDVQEEMMTDVAAYTTKWSRLIFVVYDTGVIHDPSKTRAENMKRFGVTVLIVKH
jgi:hypothetical protein